MSHWLVDSLSEKRVLALQTAERIQIYQELLNQKPDVDYSELEGVANALELATMDLLLERFEEDETKLKLLRGCASVSTDTIRIIQAVNLIIGWGILVCLLHGHETQGIPTQKYERYSRTFA